MECAVKRRKIIYDTNGNGVTLTYGIFENIVRVEGLRIEVYGVGVHADNGKEMEWEVVPDISPCRNQVERLVDILCEQDVTPTTLKDIIDDYIEN